jgi:hypothetical protein
MLDLRSRRVDPRKLLRDLRENPRELSANVIATSSGAPQTSSRRLTFPKSRFALVAGSAVVCLTAFGGVVVQANDDSGVMNFFRQNSRPIVRSAPQQYYAPQPFFPRGEARRAPVAAAYAPYVGYAPLPGIRLQEPRRRAAGTKSRVTTTLPLTLPAPSRTRDASPAGGLTIGRTAYCVRTCDGFFFPLTGHTRGGLSEEATCRQLCPTAEVRVYVSHGSADIEDARSRETGRRYAQMSNALAYRSQRDASCTCSATGVGLTNLKDGMKDPSLRRGDIVMTPTGMRIFADGSFTGLEQSRDISARSRELLRRVQNASMPGRSGITAGDVRNAEKERVVTNQRTRGAGNVGTRTEAAELAKAAAIANRVDAATIDGKRYVGPDLPSAMR